MSLQSLFGSKIRLPQPPKLGHPTPSYPFDHVYLWEVVSDLIVTKVDLLRSFLTSILDADFKNAPM